MYYPRLGHAAGGAPVTRIGVEYLGAGQDDCLKLRIEIRPPATSTRPSGSRVAEWRKRGSVMLPTAVHWPVAVWYTSAVVVARRRWVNPPTTNISPLGSRVAVWKARASFRFPV